MCIHVSAIVEEGSESESMETEVTRYGFHTESRMRENCTLRLCDATASQAGSMRGGRRKTAKSVLRVVEDRAGVPDNKGRSALLYTSGDGHVNSIDVARPPRPCSKGGMGPRGALAPWTLAP